MEENERREGVLKQHFALYAKKPSMKDCFVTVFIFMICTIIGLFLPVHHCVPFYGKDPCYIEDFFKV